MGVFDEIQDTINQILGVSLYQPSKTYGPELGDDIVQEIRKALGGNIQPLPVTRLRWYLEDLERAQSAADMGNMAPAAQLYRAMRRDGVLSGLLGSRSSSFTRLPKNFYGNPDVAEALRAKNGSRSVFDEMHPPAEVKLLNSDGIALGVGIAERVPVPGRDYPVMRRLDPENLYFLWAENRWYFRSIAGRLPVIPGDGRWILHTPGGAMSPWQFGLWPALGRSFINKEHAMAYRANYCAKLANAARAATTPLAASERQKEGWIKKVIAWGVNTVFEMPPGYDVKLIESNGIGHQVFKSTIETSDNEYMISLAGQVVTTTGGAGFSNANVPKAIRQDLVKDDAEAMAYTLNTQSLPWFIAERFGVEELRNGATVVDWDADEPKDKEAIARTLTQVAAAIKALTEALAMHKREVRIDELTTQFGIPTEPLTSTTTAALAAAPANDDGNVDTGREEEAAQ